MEKREVVQVLTVSVGTFVLTSGRKKKGRGRNQSISNRVFYIVVFLFLLLINHYHTVCHYSSEKKHPTTSLCLSFLFLCYLPDTLLIESSLVFLFSFVSDCDATVLYDLQRRSQYKYRYKTFQQKDT